MRLPPRIENWTKMSTTWLSIKTPIARERKGCCRDSHQVHRDSRACCHCRSDQGRNLQRYRTSITVCQTEQKGPRHCAILQCAERVVCSGGPSPTLPKESDYYPQKPTEKSHQGCAPPWTSGNDQTKASDKGNVFVSNHEQYDRTGDFGQCFKCQATRKQYRQEPIKVTGIPKKPWDVIAVGFSGLSMMPIII